MVLEYEDELADNFDDEKRLFREEPYIAVVNMGLYKRTVVSCESPMVGPG